MVHRSRPTQETPSRISVTLPPEAIEDLREIAKAKKVSIAWVVRDAVEKYLHDESPLLHPRR